MLQGYSFGLDVSVLRHKVSL